MDSFDFTVSTVLPGSKPLRVYPNPAGSILVLDLPMPVAGATLYLYDLHGRMVQHAAVESHHLDVSGLPAGMYQLVVTLGPEVYTTRVVIGR